MNTTDKDIQVLEEMRDSIFDLCTVQGDGWTAQEQDTHNALSNILSDFRDMREKWIPVSERLPEGCGLYNVTWFNGVENIVCTALFSDGKWWIEEEEPFNWEILAWMPLPDAWREGKGEK